MSFRSRRRRNPSDGLNYEAIAWEIGIVALSFSSQLLCHSIGTGISPLTLRNDMKHTYFRTHVGSFLANPPKWAENLINGAIYSWNGNIRPRYTVDGDG